MSGNDLLLEENDIKSAQEVCSIISDDSKRELAVANCLAVNLASKFFENNGIFSDSKSGIHNIPEIADKYDISDIYVNGNYVDVRLFFNSNGIAIPSFHTENGIIPALYMFIKLDEDFSSAECAGFILPENVDRTLSYGTFIKINEKDLMPLDEAEKYLADVSDEEISGDFEKSVFDFPECCDGEFIKTLLCSKSARKLLSDAMFAKHAIDMVEFNEEHQDADIFAETNEETFSQDELISDELSSESDILGESTDIGSIADDDEVLTLSSDDSDELLQESFDDENSSQIFNNDVMLSDEDEGILLPDADEAGIDNDVEISSMSDEIDSSKIEFGDGAFDEQLFNEDINMLPSDGYDYDNNAAESGDEPLAAAEPEQESSSAKEDADIENYESNAIEEYNVENDDTPEDNDVKDDFDELSEYDYSTEITQNITLDEDEVQHEDDLEDSSEVQQEEDMLESEPAGFAEENSDGDEEEAVIDDLFSSEPEPDEIAEIKPKKKMSPLLPILGVAVVLCAAGYLGYTKYQENNAAVNTPIQPAAIPAGNKADSQKENDAMPNETIENTSVSTNKNEGTAVSIPEIEQNLGGSVDVSALSVSWEVPSAFASNPTAKRYFVKLGKVMQLNLKTELLLQSTPPISNRIKLELEFNNNTNAFEVKNLLMSSGTQKIDEVIQNTVQNILKMNLNTNMSVFGSLKGNPILIIKL